jgi:ParB-like chromosome segregation protein Spo0J
MTQFLQLSDITTFRDDLDDSKVQDLVTLIRAGVQLPPIIVRAFDAGGYLLEDGRHRMRSHELAGRTEIEVELIDGQAEVRDGIRILRRAGNASTHFSCGVSHDSRSG